MGFLNKLFGTQPENPEEKEKRQTEEQFGTLRHDGIRARNMGEFPYAEQCLAKALELKDDNEVRGVYAEVLMHLQKHEVAAEQLRILAEKEPDNFNVLLLLANAQGDAGQFEAQAVTAKTLMEKDPADARAKYMAAEAAHGLGEEFGAIAFLTQAIEAEPRYGQARLLRANILLDMGQAKEALEDAEALVELQDNEDFRMLRAKVYLATGEKEKATADYQAVRDFDPFNEEAVLGLIRLAQKDNPEEALRLCDEAIEQIPLSAEIYKQRGTIKLQLHDKEGAEDDIKKALELDPEKLKDINGEYYNIENEMNARYRAQNPYGF